MRHKPIQIRTDFGTVELDEEMLQAIDLIQDAAGELHLTPAEFISTFDYGIPECPCCKTADEKLTSH